MSGHSKWNNIKRTKEKSDAQKGKIFTKLGREIAVAVKSGGADPETNSKLKDCIAKAKSANMPNDSIQRSIKKASGELDSINYEEITYEGYGVGGVAVIVECLTDNKNRTAGDVRHAFDKFGGSLGSAGCVSYLFSKQAVVVLDKTGVDMDKLFEDAMEVDVDDLQEVEDAIEIVGKSENLSLITEHLEKSGYKILSAEAQLVPSNYVELDDNKRTTFERMLDKLDESDDVQEIYHNAILD